MLGSLFCLGFFLIPNWFFSEGDVDLFWFALGLLGIAFILWEGYEMGAMIWQIHELSRELEETN